ncbi:hypothetical protein BOSE62_130434 [Bosea sp. 62]|nr:hypothetical protein BOSE7B_120442 [Bosea sp. 7B]CAD5277258.1 hypothetical protein BOSE21B_30472 [Bosea sp. 21B]CAD5278342.1 hypothetical protein BOSE46_40117 [Bosea sp. 46]VVT59789.1 hypothetical protein BOS5A_210580 [Bosea sp. EC-HK365B]VXB43499.1 hypothetical protein BOSE62_130434 [Bosea sp. 62]VXC05136.1 hypothetical protein BOSE127_170081 [Bosea sp. 127]VXC25591.1 hypothetical protein BOSE29B_30446 [Bosea sp. 29B]VXC76741.1 hypothetical protein BOSE125_50118 [Bosea sp. 125]
MEIGLCLGSMTISRLKSKGGKGII